MPVPSPVLLSADRRPPEFRGVPRVAALAVSGAAQIDHVRWPSPGAFELVRVDAGRILLRILDGNGMILALSGTYPDIDAAVNGVEAVREAAASSHISDQTGTPGQTDLHVRVSPAA